MTEGTLPARTEKSAAATTSAHNHSAHMRSNDSKGAVAMVINRGPIDIGVC